MSRVAELKQVKGCLVSQEQFFVNKSLSRKVSPFCLFSDCLFLWIMSLLYDLFSLVYLFFSLDYVFVESTIIFVFGFLG